MSMVWLQYRSKGPWHQAGHRCTASPRERQKNDKNNRQSKALGRRARPMMRVLGRLLLCLILLSAISASLVPSGPRPVSGGAGTGVSSCQVISQPGDYFLTLDISLLAYPTSCI